jgi:hypothetical protein
MQLLVIFAALALLPAGVGIYGVEKKLQFCRAVPL